MPVQHGTGLGKAVATARGTRDGWAWRRRARRALEDWNASDEGCLVAFGALHEALAAGGKIVDDFVCVEAQAGEIDEVDVGARAGLESPAVVEAEEIGGFAGQALDDVFERQAGAAFAVAGPMGQHVSGRARIDDHRDMRAARAPRYAERARLACTGSSNAPATAGQGMIRRSAPEAR
jgi:hypothetical protein